MIDRRVGAGVLVAAASLVTAGLLYAAEEHHWSYQGSTGPAKWGSLEHEYSTCGVGKTQSPIDIEDSVAKKSDLPAITFNYKPSPLKIVDNGHTVQVIYAPGSSITVAGKQYDLVQFHFHKPSEEKINNKPADMVVHLVHRDSDGKLAVVAVLLQATGAANPLIETLWKNVPKEKEKEQEVPGVQVNAADLLPANKAAYYTFMGSLTTPPCSEGVTWFVLKTRTTISKDELASFGMLYPMNARPTQALNGRELRVTK
jgi:carbonic anhydrase